MADGPKNVLDSAFIVRQAGLTYGTEGYGAIVGFNDKDSALANAYDRNSRAKEMGLEATYEAVAMANRKPF